MDSLDRLINTSVENEKALADFKKELVNILDIKYSDIKINIGTSTLHSTIQQYLIVEISNINSFTGEQLELIPFYTMGWIRGHVYEFTFKIGENCI